MIKVIIVFFISSVLSACVKNYNDEELTTNAVKRNKYYVDKPVNDSGYDQYPQFDSLTNIADVIQTPCLPCVCGTDSFCVFNNQNYVVKTDSAFKNLFATCKSFYPCDSLPVIDFNTHTLVGMQLSGGAWLETADFKFYYNSADSLYYFDTKIQYDSNCAYILIYVNKSLWTLVPKLSPTDSVVFNTWYYGNICK
jgi:hypothetical protein